MRIRSILPASVVLLLVIAFVFAPSWRADACSPYIQAFGRSFTSTSDAAVSQAPPDVSISTTEFNQTVSPTPGGCGGSSTCGSGVRLGELALQLAVSGDASTVGFRVEFQGDTTFQNLPTPDELFSVEPGTSTLLLHLHDYQPAMSGTFDVRVTSVASGVAGLPSLFATVTF